MPSNLELLRAIATQVAAKEIAEAVTPLGDGKAAEPKKGKGVIRKLVEVVANSATEPISSSAEQKAGAFEIGLREAGIKAGAEAGAGLGLTIQAAISGVLSDMNSPITVNEPSTEELAAKEESRKSRQDAAKKTTRAVGRAAGGAAVLAGKAIGGGAGSLASAVGNAGKAWAASRAAKAGNPDEKGMTVVEDDHNTVDGSWEEL